MRPAAAVALALALAPLAAGAQGLGDAAAREKRKRETAGASEPKRVFTDADLPAAAAPAGPASAADAGTAPAEGAGTAPAEGAATAPAEGAAKAAPPAAAVGASAARDDDPVEAERRERRRLETDWRVRFANARERLALAEAASWREVVRTEIYQGLPVPMKVREKVETPELVAARQAMADLEEEYRRTGLPPGWAREP